MMITAIVSLFLPALVGPQFLNHFGWIHLFSFLTLYSIPTALIAIKQGKVRKHKIKMIMLYVGAIMIAGGFTLVPGRYLHGIFFG
ncbi:membrane protein [Nonlabens ulvanivorans]|nr:membrane protein [Nonlabens ulvanivorans]